MTMVSFGDLAQSFVLKSQTARLKGDMGRITQELGSGRVADVGSAVSGDFSRLSALARSRATTQGYQSAAREAVAQADGMQSVIATLSDHVQALISPLLSAAHLITAEQVALVGTDARARLTDVMSALNTSVGGRALFAGVAIQGPAVAEAETMLAALRGELVGATSANDAMTRISAWFDDPAGYTATAYQGGAALDDLAVSPNDRIWLGATANDPAMRALLKGLAATALITDAGNPLPPSERGTFTRLATETLAAGQDRLIHLEAKIGISQSRIDAAQSRNAADLLSLELAQGTLVQSDPYRLATELEAVQTNLETVYAITARLSRLSLTDFLR